MVMGNLSLWRGGVSEFWALRVVVVLWGFRVCQGSVGVWHGIEHLERRTSPVVLIEVFIIVDERRIVVVCRMQDWVRRSRLPVGD